jgi:ubiquinone/menaquinone biosynthesis C-methylase UbiE
MMTINMDEGLIEGVDLSSAMVSIARKRNKNNIERGMVKISEGDIDNIPYKKEKDSKACSVNTLYFGHR